MLVPATRISVVPLSVCFSSAKSPLSVVKFATSNDRFPPKRFISVGVEKLRGMLTPSRSGMEVSMVRPRRLMSSDRASLKSSEGKPGRVTVPPVVFAAKVAASPAGFSITSATPALETRTPNSSVSPRRTPRNAPTLEAASLMEVVPFVTLRSAEKLPVTSTKSVKVATAFRRANRSRLGPTSSVRLTPPTLSERVVRLEELLISSEAVPLMESSGSPTRLSVPEALRASEPVGPTTASSVPLARRRPVSSVVLPVVPPLSPKKPETLVAPKRISRVLPLPVVSSVKFPCTSKTSVVSTELSAVRRT